MKTTKLLDCALGVCAVIRSITAICQSFIHIVLCYFYLMRFLQGSYFHANRLPASQVTSNVKPYFLKREKKRNPFKKIVR